jgi:hypothetical protein
VKQHRLGERVLWASPRWFRPKSLLLFALAIVASAIALGSVGVKPALACGSFWTVGCQNYSYHEGHAITNQGGDSYEWVYTTFSPSNLSVRAIWTSANGNWYSSQDLLWGYSVEFTGESATDRNGCYNDHDLTMWINCRAADSSS